MKNICIVISPIDDLIDVSRTIQITGLVAKKTIKIETVTERGHGTLWRSHAEFIADENGIVDLSKQSPLRGSYSGIDPMGLIWSQKPDEKDARELFPANMLIPLETIVTVTVDAKVVQSGFTQRIAAQGVQRIEIQEKNLVGTVYLPATKGPHPAIMILNGSGGGINEHRAALYASRGYIAFSLAYFKAPGLSDYISNTPLEYFKQGLDWLRQTYAPLNNFVAVNGQSRGGELVLLLASLFPEDVSAVIAYVPAAFVHSGQNAADPTVGREGPTWLFQGKPLPHIWENNKTATWTPFDEGPAPHRHEKAILTALKDTNAIEKARIPVERIQSPIILLSATDDGAWPSSLYSKMIVDRLEQYSFSHDLRWIDTPEGGHSIVFPYIPTTQTTYIHPVSGRISTNGGSPQANALSNFQSWQEIKDFLSHATKGK